MKKLFNILLMVAVIVCSVGCNPDDPAVDPESINAIKTTYNIGAEGGSLELQVSANVDFTVTCADSWVKYSTTKAAETKTVVVTVEPNTSTERRTTKVVVKGTEKQAEITIVQDGAEPAEPDILEAGTTTYSVAAEGGEINVAVTTNVDMTVKTDASWIKYTSTKAASQKTVCFTIEANTAYEARSGKATISGGDKTVEIVFNQAAAVEPDPDRLEVAKTEYTIGAEGGSVEVAVSTNSEVSATTSQSWAKYVNTKAKREMANKTLVFSVEANTAAEERTVTATITAGTQSATVTIKQSAAQGGSTENPEMKAGQTTYNVPAAGQDIVVEVTTNIEYTVECAAQWITKVETKASRVDRVTFTVAANEGEARSAQIKFVYSADLTVVVTVSQEAYVAPDEDAVLELSATEFQFSAEGEEVVVSVTHNYEYTVNGAPEWVTVDIDGDDCFITVAENEAPEARTAMLTFASKGLSKTVAIAQEAGNEPAGDPLDVGPYLSINETANTYVVTKAGDYTFSAAVMGNGEGGYLSAWVDSQDLLNPGESFYLYPESPDLVTFQKSDLKKAKAVIIWEEGDCIDGDPTYISADKTIAFKANGNKGAALIGLYTQYDDVLWSWLIWCTDRPAEIAFTDMDGDEVQMMDRNIGATSANPEDGRATYGYVFNFGRKDPIRPKDDIAHTEFIQNSSKSYYETIQNPTKAFKPVGRDIEYFNGSVGTLTPDLWGDPYMPCTFSLRQSFDQTEVADVKKTIYDPCPPGYQVPPARVYDNIKIEDVHLVSNLGVNIDVTGGSAYFPFAGFCDGGNEHGGNNGWYGYTGYVRGSGDFDRTDELMIKVWTATEGDYPGTDYNWLAGQAFALNYDPATSDLSLIQHPDHNLGISRNDHSIRIRLINVRCMRYVKE